MSLLDHFASPWFLLLLPAAIPFVVLLSRRSLAGLGPVRRRISVALRVLTVAALVLALAETRLLWRDDRLAVIFLVDRSASVPPDHQRAALEFAAGASTLRDRGRQDRVGCVVFGRNAGIEAAPRAADLFEQGQGYSILISRDATDIEAGFRLATAAFPEGHGKRIVLISDGNENRGDALAAARVAAADGVAIDTLAIRYEYPGEILVDKVVVDPEVHLGEPFDVRVVVDSTVEARATLRVLRNGAVVSTSPVELDPGKNVVRLPQRLDAAADLAFEYEATIEPEEGTSDALLQNNRAHAFTFVRGVPSVLLCTPDATADAALVEALRQERMVVEVMSPERLPAEVGGYLRYSSIIFSNVNAADVPAERQKLLESLVKGAGIGFVMIGGDESFGAGGYLGTPVEELLPVSMDVKQKKSLPNGALAVIMHSCEIDNGNFWARATVQQAIRVLSPQDYCGLLYYSDFGAETWLFPMLPCTRKRFMIRRLAGLAVGDMPDFGRIFDMAHKALNATPAAIKHIIVFSDGDPAMPSDSKLDRIRKDGITTSAICMGWHSTPANMQRLARKGGGNYYSLTGPKSLPQIFIREAITVRKALIQERDFQPIVERGGGFLAGVDLTAIPPLRGYVVTGHKEAADDYLSAPAAGGEPVPDPLLSAWQYGLGRSVAFTSDDGGKWAAAWGAWPEYRKFWGQTVRWVSKKQTDDRFRVTSMRDGDRAVVSLDAIDAEGRFVNGIDFEATIISPGPDYTSTPVEVRQTAPGRYQAEVELSSEGSYLLSFKHTAGGAASVYWTGLVNPYSPEYRNLATNDALLQRIADVTGGTVLDTLPPGERESAVFRRDFPVSSTPQELWRLLLQIAAVLFFADVFVRRVLVDPAAAARRAAALVAALAGRARARPAADPALDALLRRKREIAREQEARARFYSAPETAEGGRDDGEGTGTGAGTGTGTGAAGGEEAAAAARRSAAAARERQREKAVEEDTYTSRLLAAKRRALRGRGPDRGDGSNTTE